MSLWNALTVAILRSPFHRLLSGSVMLLAFHGRVTGRRYEFPVEYSRRADTITLFTWRYRRWWNNLRSPAPVTLLIAGREHAGIAEQVPANHEHMVAALRERYPWLSATMIEQTADDRVMLIIKLSASTEAAGAAARAA